MSIEILKLKNGAKVPKPIVLTALITLDKFIEDGDGALLYELYRKAQNPEYEIVMDHVAKKLSDYAFLNHNGEMHRSLKDVVLSRMVFDEENFEFTFQNPVDFSGKANIELEQ